MPSDDQESKKPNPQANLLVFSFSGKIGEASVDDDDLRANLRVQVFVCGFGRWVDSILFLSLYISYCLARLLDMRGSVWDQLNWSYVVTISVTLKIAQE